MEQKPKRAEVKVDDVIQELDSLGQEVTVYFNKVTGEFIPVSDEEERHIDSNEEDEGLPDWQRDLIPKIREALKSKDAIALPDPFEIHEWAIMRDFCASFSDPEISSQLLDAIHGSGAFGRFHSQIRALGKENDWYLFRKEAFREIAIRWLEENDIPYQKDNR